MSLERGVFACRLFGCFEVALLEFCLVSLQSYTYNCASLCAMRREYRCHAFFFPVGHLGPVPSTWGNPTRTREEPVPVFIDQLWILGQFSPNHQLLDPVDRVDIVHAVDNDASDLFEALVGAHGGDSVALDEDVAVCEQLDGLYVSWTVSAPMRLNPPHAPRMP